MKYLLTGVD